MGQDHYSTEEQIERVIDSIDAVVVAIDDDVRSDAAYLDECAMRIAAGMVAAGTHVEPQRELGSATAQIAYRIAEAMLAERKRRREGGA